MIKTILVCSRAAYRLIAFAVILHLYTLEVVAGRLRGKKLCGVSVSTSYAAKLLRVLSVSVTVRGKENLRKSLGGMVVSNHLSYLDIPVLLSQFPQRFVTSIQIRDTFFLGFLTRLGEALFVERRSNLGLPGEIKTLAHAVGSSAPVTLFPEATSSDGSRVLPFRSALFESAVKARATVTPLVINYERIGGTPFSISNHHIICWYGTMKFLPHFLRLMIQGPMQVTITVLTPVSAGTFNRKTLAARVYNEIRAHYRGYAQ